MVREEGYNKGLDAALSGKINIDDMLEVVKGALYYAAYILPGVGIYRQFKKPRGERSILGTIGFSIYAIPFVVKVAYLPLYIGIGTITKEWNPANHVKNIIENIKGVVENIREKKENKLEKTMRYEDFPFEN